MMKEYRIPATSEQNFSPSVDKNIPYVQFIAEPGSLMKVLSTFHAGVHIVAIKSNHGSASDSLIELRTYAVGEGMPGQELIYLTIHLDILLFNLFYRLIVWC